MTTVTGETNMADDLDLERGDPSRGEERRTRRRDRERATASSESKTTTAKLDNELQARLVGSLEQVQEWRAARDDTELADAIGEDKEKMAKGLVSLTHTLQPLRQPLLIFLGFVEPCLAFGRVGRILTVRWVERRQQRAEELAAQQAAWDADHQPQPAFQ
jgi:hypothetical protein